jgi:hypothetical protein
MFGLKNDEILTCLLLIFVGYTIAKMFSKRCEGFSTCPSTNVDACSLHYSDCENKYTDDSADSGFHTCKKGGLFNAYRCISSGDECRLDVDKSCIYDSDCVSGSCISGKCTKPLPSPPPPSCPPGQSYCISGDGTGNKGCYPECKKDNMRGTDCLCLPKCCFNDPDKCPGGRGVCDP